MSYGNHFARRELFHILIYCTSLPVLYLLTLEAVLGGGMSRLSFPVHYCRPNYVLLHLHRRGFQQCFEGFLTFCCSGGVAPSGILFLDPWKKILVFSLFKNQYQNYFKFVYILSSLYIFCSYRSHLPLYYSLPVFSTCWPSCLRSWVRAAPLTATISWSWRVASSRSISRMCSGGTSTPFSYLLFHLSLVEVVESCIDFFYCCPSQRFSHHNASFDFRSLTFWLCSTLPARLLPVPYLPTWGLKFFIHE